MRYVLALAFLFQGWMFAQDSGGVDAGSLPINTWTLVPGGQGMGVRSGATVSWVEKDRCYLVVGGVSGMAEDNVPRVYETQSFDPVSGRWVNLFPKDKAAEWAGKNGASVAPKFPGPSNQLAYLNFADEKGNVRLEDETSVAGFSAFDSQQRRMYICLSGHGNVGGLPKVMPIVRFNFVERTWEIVSGGLPPTKAVVTPFNSNIEGVKLVMDPVNNELLLLGGRCQGASRGSLGWWAFSPEKKEWRALSGASAVLDPLRQKCLSVRSAVREGETAARNLFYDGLEPAVEAESAKAGPGKLLGQAVKSAEEAFAAVQAAKADGWEAEAIKRAQPLMADALANLRTAAAGLAAGKVDAALLKASFQSQWALDEAASLLASAPDDCEKTSAAFDPSQGCVVAFGGDHGDFVHNQTWITTVSRGLGSRSFPHRHPLRVVARTCFGCPGGKS